MWCIWLYYVYKSSWPCLPIYFLCHPSIEFFILLTQWGEIMSVWANVGCSALWPQQPAVLSLHSGQRSLLWHCTKSPINLLYITYNIYLCTVWLYMYHITDSSLFRRTCMYIHWFSRTHTVACEWQMFTTSIRKWRMFNVVLYTAIYLLMENMYNRKHNSYTFENVYFS